MMNRKTGAWLGVLLVMWTLVGAWCQEAEPQGEERVWTDRLGRELTAYWDMERETEFKDAELEGTYDYPLPLIRSKDKKSYTLQLEKLSEADRDYVVDTRKATQNAEEDPFADSPIPTGKSKKKATAATRPAPGKDAGKSAPAKPRLPKPKAGEQWIVTLDDVQFSFRYCPAGTLTIPAGRQPLRIRIPEGFWMLETEVTQEQWQVVMGANPAHFKGDMTRPVEQVNWFDANQFCAKISGLLKTQARLPTGLQWMYACCAGKPLAGNVPDILDRGWVKGNSLGKTHAAAQLTANEWGIHDMYGNVWEWCAECVDARKRPVPASAPEQKEASALHCGGSWYCDAPQLGKETLRDADHRIFDVGFRFCVTDEIRVVSE